MTDRDGRSTAGSPVVVVIGAGRAGGSFANALRDRDIEVTGPLGRTDDLGSTLAAALGSHGGPVVVMLCVRDAEVEPLAAEIAEEFPTWPRRLCVVHVAGSLTLGAVSSCARHGSVHPLVALPDPHRGGRLLVGATMAVAGDAVAADIARSLDARVVEVDDERRVAYHAAATIASNHLVALMDQAARVAAQAGVPLDAYLPLVRATLDNVEALGPRDALTGPASRGDLATLRRHVEALEPDDRVAYRAMADLAAHLAGQRGL